VGFSLPLQQYDNNKPSFYELSRFSRQLMHGHPIEVSILIAIYIIWVNSADPSVATK